MPNLDEESTFVLYYTEIEQENLGEMKSITTELDLEVVIIKQVELDVAELAPIICD